jgi:hypothetical protein
MFANYIFKEDIIPSGSENDLHIITTNIGLPRYYVSKTINIDTNEIVKYPYKKYSFYNDDMERIDYFMYCINKFVNKYSHIILCMQEVEYEIIKQLKKDSITDEKIKNYDIIYKTSRLEETRNLEYNFIQPAKYNVILYKGVELIKEDTNLLNEIAVKLGTIKNQKSKYNKLMTQLILDSFGWIRFKHINNFYDICVVHNHLQQNKDLNYLSNKSVSDDDLCYISTFFEIYDYYNKVINNKNNLNYIPILLGDFNTKILNLEQFFNIFKNCISYQQYKKDPINQIYKYILDILDKEEKDILEEISDHILLKKTFDGLIVNPRLVNMYKNEIDIFGRIDLTKKESIKINTPYEISGNHINLGLYISNKLSLTNMKYDINEINYAKYIKLGGNLYKNKFIEFILG